MSFQYIFLEKAQAEYEDALHWYAKRGERTAENFALAVTSTLELICEAPHRWRNEYANFHELGLKGFPFSIVYFIDDEGLLVVVAAVFHQKRNPAGKYKP